MVDMISSSLSPPENLWNCNSAIQNHRFLFAFAKLFCRCCDNLMNWQVKVKCQSSSCGLVFLVDTNFLSNYLYHWYLETVFIQDYWIEKIDLSFFRWKINYLVLERKLQQNSFTDIDLVFRSFAYLVQPLVLTRSLAKLLHISMISCSFRSQYLLLPPGYRLVSAQAFLWLQ